MRPSRQQSSFQRPKQGHFANRKANDPSHSQYRVLESPQARPVASPGFRNVGFHSPGPSVAQSSNRFSHSGFVGSLPPPPIHSPNATDYSSSGNKTPLRTTHRVGGSSHGFVPIPKEDNYAGFNPSASPYNFRKATPSPSMMSTITDETMETDSISMADSPRVGSPIFGAYRPGTPQSRDPYRPNTPQYREPYRPVTPQSHRDSVGMYPSTFGSPSSYYRPGTPQTPRPKTPTGRKSPAPRTPGGRKSPFPKTDDEATRKTRIKTEMCMHYVQNRPCPWGANCTYAHGEEELQMTKLLDLEKAGLVDLETFRTKPCLAWVMTGSCPFGKRCTSIHDPRVGGTSPSWLTHTETQGNTIDTDINVESLHHKRNNEIHYGTPFGHKFSLEHDNWSDLYKLVCNIDYAKRGWIGKHRRHQQQIDPLVKLQIALQMRGGSTWHFKFRPQHLIHDEPCMILQQKGFCIMGDGKPVEIPLATCDPAMNESHIYVLELAFGPDSESSARGVSLWFNINESDVTTFTQAQAKRFRWKRSLKKEDKTNKPTSIFDTMDGFEMHRPTDSTAYELATDIMKHRVDVLTKERLVDMRERFEALEKLKEEKKVLQDRFEKIRRAWVKWAWPVNDGRDKVDKNTPVPKIDEKYEFKKDLPGEGAEAMGAATETIWGVFVTEDFVSEGATDSNEVPSYLSKTNSSGFRLPIFQKLASGVEIDSDRTLPHIQDSYHADSQPATMTSTNESVDPDLSERCWRSLLIKPSRPDEVSEWYLVREHFEKSRSKKVLSIIQSKSATSPPPGLDNQIEAS